MHVYSHHIGDFNTATLHLSRLERSIYRDAIEYYYSNESALDGSDFDRLARRLRCESEAEKVALQFVLDEFFDLDIESACYVQPRCERELQAYQVAVAASGVVKQSVNRRQENHRRQRKVMFAELARVGVHLPGLAPIAEVRAAFKEHCKGVDLSRLCHDAVTANLSPLPSPLSPFSSNTPQPPCWGGGSG